MTKIMIRGMRKARYLSSEMADEVPMMEGAILDEGLAGRNTSLQTERSVK
jgi:hypothetical protein